MLLGTFAWVLPLTGAGTVLLPAKIALIAPDSKVAVVALLTIVGAIAALLANVIFGALSDLTRSRFGSRTPWIVGGGLTGGAAMFFLSNAQTTGALVFVWCLVQFAANALVASLMAVLPDRVPPARRGTVATIVALGFFLGTAGSQLLGAHYLDHPSDGLRVFALVLAVLPILAVLIAPDTSNRHVLRETFEAKNLLRHFALPSLKGATDFYWALVGRLIIILGYAMVGAYQLYIVTDYLHLSGARVAALIGEMALLTLAGSLISAGISGPLSDRSGRRKLPVIIATLLFAVATLLPALLPTVTGMLAFALMSGLGLGCYFAVDSALMSEVLPDGENRGKDMGILNTANTAGQVLAPAISSGIIGLGFGFGPVFIVAMLFCLIGAATILPIRAVR
ncbi:MFS transporter [Deinococcus alpinitundrae]|uniref:MFS transporter n=1 Tax=Deinococcus alpinitundrae TaxID=468913 RepID=UPI001379CD28|nr:MFS transporter [Deinococcus alpinitundrae]